MKLFLFDSLTNQINCLVIVPQQKINLYLCGPTVYDHIHLGNLRPIMVFDVLHRLLLTLGLKVNYVHNITDIDDKIIEKAQKEKKTEQAITNHYSKVYFQNLYNTNILSPTFLPKVTNHILQIQDFISKLQEKKVAYQQGKNVLFSLKNQVSYGQLSKQNLTKLITEPKAILSHQKKDFKDFYLWKETSEGITWSSPWGKGRPGWHTECVSFIQNFFAGETIDIHGGGKDLLFPHHENERIQYLAYNNQELSRIWLHINHINWKEEKMSKSLGNVILAKHFVKKYGANIVRHLILSSNFQQEIKLSENLIEQSVNYVAKLENLFKRLRFYFYLAKISIPNGDSKNIFLYKEKVMQTLSNNLNTAKCFYFLDEIIGNLNRFIDKNRKDKEFFISVNDLSFVLEILGFKFDLSSYNLSVKVLLKQWEIEQLNKNYAKADKIREQLQKIKIL